VEHRTTIGVLSDPEGVDWWSLMYDEIGWALRLMQAEAENEDCLEEVLRMVMRSNNIKHDK
jgi:hypothetical protein